MTSSSSDASSVSSLGVGSIYDFCEAHEGGGEDEGDDDDVCPPCDDDDADADGELSEAACDLADSAQLSVQHLLNAARRARAAQATRAGARDAAFLEWQAELAEVEAEATAAIEGAQQEEGEEEAELQQLRYTQQAAEQQAEELESEKAALAEQTNKMAEWKAASKKADTFNSAAFVSRASPTGWPVLLITRPFTLVRWLTKTRSRTCSTASFTSYLLTMPARFASRARFCFVV